MKSHKKYPSRSGYSKYKGKRYTKKSPKKYVPIRPKADPKLKPVFSAIGTPEKSPFSPDRYQTLAVETSLSSDCLVTAPTGAGKTWIAVQAITRVFQSGKKAWYASPLKALTNSKMEEFSRIFGRRNVGILTGDRKENPDAPIIVGTTEILRNQLYDAMHLGISIDTDYVVIDEAHYLGDEDRGVVWEETLIYLPARVPLLMLSATVGNADRIAQWLSTIRQRPCTIVKEEKRPVPLFPLVLHPSGTLLPMLAKRGGKTKGKKLYKKVADLLGNPKKKGMAYRGKLPPFGDILKVLKKYNLLPAIFFLKSRADCDAAVTMCFNKPPISENKKARLNHRVAHLVKGAPHLSRHRQRHTLCSMAVGSHHSGQLPGWKLVLETLMSEGLLDAIFATSTVAAGVNFPARTVVFLNSDRFNGIEFVPLDPTQLLQMTGRAGRRGMDKIGFSMAIPGRYMDLRLIARLLTSKPSDIFSRIRINFSMCLNLLLSHIPEQIEEILKRSFATYLLINADGEGKARRRMEDVHEVLWDDFLRHLDFLQETGFVDDDFKLTADGVWAAQLRIDQPLVVAESLRQSLLPVDNPEQMAAAFAAFVNEKETDERMEGKLFPNVLKKKILGIRKGLKGFGAHMVSRGFDVRPIYLKPAAAMFAWASGVPWERVSSEYGMSEGDLAMMVMRCADNLRHVAALVEPFPNAAMSAKKAIDLIMRVPVVDAEQDSVTD